jgi:hypothetical protein
MYAVWQTGRYTMVVSGTGNTVTAGVEVVCTGPTSVL